ncbi:MAG TPA: ABC transporter permease [Pirellulales bacterium]|jgi:ABC-2 type transport system permease protein
MWHRISTLIVKEFLAVWRDPKSRAILIVPPLIELLVFSFAATQEVKDVRIAILNRDLGTSARDLVALFEGSPNFSSIQFLDDESQIAGAIDSRFALMVLSIQSDFSRELAAGRPTDVQLLLDGRRSNAAQIVEGYATVIITRFNEELLAARRGAVPPMTVIASRLWFNPNQTVTWNTVPSLVAILTTVMGLLVTALSVARERELGTFEQLLVSPLGPLEIIIGKTVPALFLGMAQASVMILAGVVVFRVPFEGSLLLLYGSMVVYLFAVIGVGLFVSSVAKTQQQAILGAFVFMVPAMSLSGFASPVENMPDWLQYATLCNPIRYYVLIVKGIFLKDLPASVVFANIWPMALIGMVTLSSAGWLFRHRME